jgi:hypothetical protein
MLMANLLFLLPFFGEWCLDEIFDKSNVIFIGECFSLLSFFKIFNGDKIFIHGVSILFFALNTFGGL